MAVLFKNSAAGQDRHRRLSGFARRDDRAALSTGGGLTSRLLVITAGHTGNNLFCTPALHLLRRASPTTTIGVAALSRASAGVFAGNPAVDELHVVRNAHQLARVAQGYDRVICLHPKSAPLLALLTIPAAVIPAFEAGRHHAEQILSFAAAYAGVSPTAADHVYRLAPAPHGDRLSAGNLATASRPLIGIHLGCGRTAIHGWKFFYPKRAEHPKLWPVEHCIELARLLRSQLPRAGFVVTGSRNENFLANRFCRHIGRSVNIAGSTSTAELAGVIAGLDLFITHDCGVLHVAAATSTPLLGLFGATSPEQTGPWPPAPHHRVVRANSMMCISPKAVTQAALALLQP